MIEMLTARIACFVFDTPRLNPSEHFDGIGQDEWPALIEAHASIDPGRVRPIRARYYDAADRHFRRWFFAQTDQFRRMYLDVLAIVAQDDISPVHPLYLEHCDRSERSRAMAISAEEGEA